MAKPKDAEPTPATLPSVETEDGRWELMRRASAGDKAAVRQVGRVLDRDAREGGRIGEAYGDIADHAARTLAKYAAGTDAAVEAALVRKVNALRDELAGPNPTPLERILCERVALCWLDAFEMDRRFTALTEISFKDAAYRESRRDRAHRRFLTACRTLATVRKLALPTLQINQIVGQQDVHVSKQSQS